MNEYHNEISQEPNYDDFFDGIVLWPRGGWCSRRLGGIPLRFVSPDKEELFRERRRKLVHRSVRRIGWVGLVAHTLAVLSEISVLGLGNWTSAKLLLFSCLSIVFILSCCQICCKLSEYWMPLIYVLAATAMMLTNRPRAAFLTNMDVVDAFAFNTTSPVVACSFSSDAVLIGNFAALVVVYFVAMPARTVVSVWCVPTFPLVYLALTIPVPQADGSLARRINLAFRIFICSCAGLLGRCWIEIGERASFLHLEKVNKDLTKEKVLRYTAEHEVERGPYSSHSDSNATTPVMPLPDDLASQLTSHASRPLSSIVFTPGASGHDAPVGMQLKAMRAVAAEEKWLIDWSELSFETNLIGKGGFALVMEGNYGGAKVAVKLPQRDQLTTSVEVVDFCGKELRVLRRLRHPFIVTFYGACIEETNRIVLIVEEFVDGYSLFDAILNSKMELSEANRRSILEKLCRALVYLHDQGPSILHGDLSPKNILLRTASLDPVLVDFGMSVLRRSKQRMLGGSPHWMAPEILRSVESGGLKPDCSVDVFSLGRIAFFISTGVAPFQSFVVEQLIEAASKANFSEMPWPIETETPFQKLCKEEFCPPCLEMNPNQRCTSGEALQTLQQVPSPQKELKSLKAAMHVAENEVTLKSSFMASRMAAIPAHTFGVPKPKIAL